MHPRLTSTLQPELKKGRFNEEHTDATDSADVSSVSSSRESDIDSNVQEEWCDADAPRSRETATNDMAVDSTNMTFESLVFNRLKELCKEHGIAVPKGAKKVDCVSLLSEKYPAPRTQFSRRSRTRRSPRRPSKKSVATLISRILAPRRNLSSAWRLSLLTFEP